MGNRHKFSADITSFHQNVSGSCTLISVHCPKEKINFLVDFGLFQREEESKKEDKNYEKLPFNPQNVNFVILTHNHADHVGRVPLLYKNGYFGKVYATHDTKKMMFLSLEDNQKIIEINAKKENKKPLYNEFDKQHTLENIITYDFCETFTPHEGVKVTFLKNAHLIGAALILVQLSCEGYDDINLLFTGDYKEHNVFFETPKFVPEWISKLPRLHIICESTYGVIDSLDNEYVFEDNIFKWLKQGKQTILIPALSLGRFQEIAYTLKTMQEKGIIDKNIPIRFDGSLAIKYNNLYKYSLNISENMKDFMPYNYMYVDNAIRNNIIDSGNTQIIVTTSGMGSFGPAQEYIPKLIERDNVGIHFTSYVADGTLGYKLLKHKNDEFVTINSVVKENKAEIATTREFSSHAKRDELVNFIKQFENVRTVLINHGEVSVKEKFANYCKHNLENTKDIAILGTGYTIRLNTWGIVKSIYEKY